MSASAGQPVLRAGRSRVAAIAVIVTAVACATAIAFREPLRSSYWAWRLEQTRDAARRAEYLTLLVGAGERAEWGVRSLLASDQAEVRQFGVRVLQHVRAEWSRGLLLGCLADADERVREFAALGVALRGEESVIPWLKAMYASRGGECAAAACLALQRMGTAAALRALTELAMTPTDAERRAALVDALNDVGTAACVPGLLILLDDERIAQRPALEMRLAADALAALRLHASGSERGITADAGLAGEAPGGQTIAERAARALARITGIPADAKAPAGEKPLEAARQRWADWQRERAGGP
jgi:HEAT repeat protein